jgi:tetratricopeptide (TPR) repeat protein
MIIQINPGLIQLFVAIEALLIIIWGVVKGGINMRRFVFAGTAVIFAFTLPWVLSHLAPGFGNATTYQLLQRYAEHAEWWWAGVYQFSSKVMLIDASAMTALNIIEMLGSLGLSIVPQQYMGVLMNLGWTLDPVDAIVESINHASQVLIAIYHTIAWLAWFSWAVAPTILGIALALLIPERTRPMGTAILLLTLAIMFFTSLAAYTLGLNQEAQLINSINQTLSTIESDLPSNMTVRGYLLLQSKYPYLVSGQLMNETMVCGPGGCHYVPEPVSWFIGFTRPGGYTVGLIDQFAYPQINNVTLLWLSVNPIHQCNLLVWPPNRNLTQEPILERCNPQLFDNNETFAEEITIEVPPFSLITETINGTEVYTGAWEWVAPPSTYSVSNGNNTVTINATINIPPMHCVNITNPKTGTHEKVCYPGTATADLWLWASSVSYPTSLGGGNWTCTLSLTNSSMYKPVDLTNQFNTIRTFMERLINETEVSRELIYPNATVPSYKLPSPTPNGYHQRELSIYCTNWNNYSVVVPLTVTIHGVGNNPWFASVPFLISPSDEWIINATIIGDKPLLINWWNTEIKQFLGFLGIPIAQWLGELAVIYGLLDGAAWFFGLPTILSPVYSIMQGVIMELSLVLYLQIRAIGRLMQRAVRKITKAVTSRLQGTHQALSTKHPRLAEALNAPIKAASKSRQTLHEYLGNRMAHHKVVNQVISRITSPTAKRAARIVLSPWHQGLGVLEQYHRTKALEYEEMGLKRKAQLHKFLAKSTKFAKDYSKISELGRRGLLFEYTRSVLSKLDRPMSEPPTKGEGLGKYVMYTLDHSRIPTMRWTSVRRWAPVLITHVVSDWADVLRKYEETEFGRVIRRLYESGQRAKAAALVLAKEFSERYIKPIRAQLNLVREDLSEVRDALARGNFTIKHVNDKTIIHFNDARLNHILESLKSFSEYGRIAEEALGKAVERVTAIVRANLTRGVLKGEYVNEVVSRLKPIRDFVEAASKGAIVSLNHPVIQRFIDFVGPEGERVIREVFSTKGVIDKDAANEIINRLKPLINKRINEEVEAARYLVAVRHHVDEVIKEFTGELGIDKRLSELEGKLRELEGFVRKVIASEFPIPKDRVAKPELFGKYEEVGGRIIVREPFSREVNLEWQLPKEVLSDEELLRTANLWLIHHYADSYYGWLMNSPGNATFNNAIYSGWVPGATAMFALHGLGIKPSQLNWGGLLDELERLDKEISNVKAQLKEVKDEATKAKLEERLSKLEDEHKAVKRALFTWADAIETLKLALPKEEWEEIYRNLPKALRDLVDVARDPRDSFESFLKKDGLKILGMVDKEGRKAGRRLSVDEVKEAVELLRKHLPMLDKLIEPVKAEVADAVIRSVNNMISVLDAGLSNSSFANTELSARSAKNMLELAKKELEGGDINNAVTHLRRAIDDLREITKEREDLAGLVGALDLLVKQLGTLDALDRLMRGQAGPVDRNQPNNPSFFADFEGL